jgi:TetR/AcrR family transcriptional regulator, transcriptional repressor of bet genes
LQDYIRNPWPFYFIHVKRPKLNRFILNISHLTPRRSYKRATQESRRQDLVDAALKLIGQGGPKAATVRAIADEAGVTAGLIRHYFKNKEELVRSAYQDLMAERDVKPQPDLQMDDASPKSRLAQHIVTVITAPDFGTDTVGKWAGFLHVVRQDDRLREMHRARYLQERKVLENLIVEAQPNLDETQLKRSTIACLAILDGLWLEGSLISDSFEQDEIAAVGLSAVGAILGIELMDA